MNKIEMTIDMRDDRLQFSSFEAHIKDSTKAHSTVLSSKKIAIEQKSSISIQILKRFISSVVTRLSEKSSSFSKIVKPSNSVNFASSFDSMNIAMIKTAAYRSLVKRSNVTTSTNLTQMQFFVDFCNFYRRFIKNFSKIVRSLIRLTQKEVIFE